MDYYNADHKFCTRDFDKVNESFQKLVKGEQNDDDDGILGDALIALEYQYTSTKEEAWKSKQALHLISSIFFHGEFKAETWNEKILETVLTELELWPTTEDDIFKRHKELEMSKYDSRKDGLNFELLDQTR